MTGERGHRQVDHTADLALEIWAPTQEQLLEEGAAAIVAVLTEGGELPSASGERVIEVDAVDAEDRLVQWLNEVIVAAVVDGFLFASADITLRGDGLVATMRGICDAAEAIMTELKSVTYHDLALTGGDDGWRARVVIDV